MADLLSVSADRRPERVLVLHNRYTQRGGEDVEFEQEVELLRKRGHAVRVIERTNSEINARRVRANAQLLVDTIWSRQSYTTTRQAIRDFRPHVMHVHNFVPLISPSVYYAAWSEGVPVVQTLQNYRLVCAGATLYRDGRICVECVGRSAWRGVSHACYRNSRLASFAVAAMVEAHRMVKTWEKVDAYVALTDFEQRTLVAGGLPSERVYKKPNFIAADDGPVRTGTGEYALYVGRLVPEKGLRTLVDAWSGAYGGMPMELPLKLIGSGPMQAELQAHCAATGGRVDFLGYRRRDEVAQLLSEARFLVYPSEWYEPFGIATIEAFAAGVPAIVTNSGGMGELIENGVTGLHVVPGDARDLARVARQLSEDLEANARMGKAARAAYLSRYTPERNYDLLLQIYGAARERRKRLAAR